MPCGMSLPSLCKFDTKTIVYIIYLFSKLKILNEVEGIGGDGFNKIKSIFFLFLLLYINKIIN
jgi:hypothetical protein